MATADARAEAAEHGTRMDIVSRDLRALTKSYHKIRSELADFQARISLDSPEFGGDNGLNMIHSHILDITNYIYVLLDILWSIKNTAILINYR